MVMFHLQNVQVPACTQSIMEALQHASADPPSYVADQNVTVIGKGISRR